MVEPSENNTEPAVRDGKVNLASNALCVAVEIGLFKSVVLSTFDNHTSVFVTPCGFQLVNCE